MACRIKVIGGHRYYSPWLAYLIAAARLRDPTNPGFPKFCRTSLSLCAKRKFGNCKLECAQNSIGEFAPDRSNVQ